MVMFINGFFLLYLYSHIIATVFQIYFSSLIIGRKSHPILPPGNPIELKFPFINLNNAQLTEIVSNDIQVI